MKISLLKSGLNIEDFSDFLITDCIIGDTFNAHMIDGIVDFDFYISDLGKLRGDPIKTLHANNDNIFGRICKGGVLLCFAGQKSSVRLPNCELDSYGWLYQFLVNKVSDLTGNDFHFLDNYDFTKILKLWDGYTGYKVVFGREPKYYEPIAENKGGSVVALYRRFGLGHIFILPKPNDVNAFVRFFISKVLPILDIDFDVYSSDTDPDPEFLQDNPVSGEEALMAGIASQEEVIEQESNKLEELNGNLEQLLRWKDLLWQTGSLLENIVKDFFGLLGLELNNIDPSGTDLVGNYNGRPVLIEVKGREGVINHREDFRQISERKDWELDNEDPIALLVGNPFRLLPPSERPQKDNSLFSPQSVAASKKREIGLILTCELFNIVNDVLSGDSGVDKQKILDSIMNTSGVYSYQRKIDS